MPHHSEIVRHIAEVRYHTEIAPHYIKMVSNRIEIESHHIEVVTHHIEVVCHHIIFFFFASDSKSIALKHRITQGIFKLATIFTLVCKHKIGIA